MKMLNNFNSSIIYISLGNMKYSDEIFYRVSEILVVLDCGVKLLMERILE